VLSYTSMLQCYKWRYWGQATPLALSPAFVTRSTPCLAKISHFLISIIKKSAKVTRLRHLEESMFNDILVDCAVQQGSIALTCSLKKKKVKAEHLYSASSWTSSQKRSVHIVLSFLIQTHYFVIFSVCLIMLFNYL